jgi:glycosyltransferase involved in cell wall biosynthesis
MRVALLALSVRGAMGQYLNALEPSLSQKVELHLFVPMHYDGRESKASVYTFETGSSKSKALAKLLNPWAARQVWKQIKAIKPDVLHLFNGEGYPWAPLFATWAKRDGIPLVVTLHDPEPHPGNIIETVNAYLRTWTLKQAKLLHIHSTAFLEIMTHKGFKAEGITVIPHGSLAHLFTPYIKEGIAREPVVLFFGRLEGYKGIDVLVQAASFLNKDLKVVIAGPGNLPHDQREYITTHPVRFELHNRYLEEQEVAELFQRAAVCVLPYKQATQSSLPLISAAFNVPVVASAVGGFLEDVPRVYGILVPPGNPEALAQGITKGINQMPYYPREMEFSVLANDFAAMYRELGSQNKEVKV